MQNSLCSDSYKFYTKSCSDSYKFYTKMNDSVKYSNIYNKAKIIS